MDAEESVADAAMMLMFAMNIFAMIHANKIFSITQPSTESQQVLKVVGIVLGGKKIVLPTPDVPTFGGKSAENIKDLR